MLKIEQYLDGRVFSNGLEVDMSSFGDIYESRLNALTDIVKNKKIIHFGCADHPPLIKDKIKNGTYLHNIFIDSAEKVVGLDYNPDGIEMMSSEFNIPDVYLFNLFESELVQSIKDDYFDFIVLGEILEHVDDPVFFLRQLKLKFKDNCKYIIVTVPNIACMSRFKYIYNDIECINTDHRYWFTPFTLAKVFVSSGFNPINIHGADVSLPSVVCKIKKKLGIYRCGVKDCETLVAIAEF